MKSGNRIIPVLLSVILLLISGTGFAQGIPEKPVPPRLVNDYANILSASDLQALETKLVAFNDSTSVQIAVVIVPTLDGYDKSDYAQQLGQKWGVGGSGLDNGFVVLVKPKSSTENGEAFIATGYGVEKFVPDATAFDIVNNEMIPYFKQNDYYGGINSAASVLISLVKGEYKAASYGKSKKKEGSSVIFILIVIIVIVFLFSRNNNNHRTINRSGSAGMLLFPWMMGGGGRGGGFGGSGGGGGGFGGFGGGSFGGGGAGGSW